MKPSDYKVQANAVAAQVAALIDVNSRRGKVAALEIMEVLGQRNSDVVALSIQNNHATDTIILVIGTPYSRPSTFAKVPNLNVANHFLDNLADLADENGNVGVPQVQLFNERLASHSVLLHRIEVLSTGATADQQKQQKLKYLFVPMNAQNAIINEGGFVAQYTEFTGVDLIDKPYVLGDFVGMAYPILAQTTVDINLHIADIDKAIFANR